MTRLRLAGEIAAAIDTLNGVINRWLRQIQADDVDPALHITQAGAGEGLRVDVGGDAFRVGPGAVARAPRLELDDAGTYLDRDASDNLTLTDAVTGTKTLAELAAAGGGGGHQIARLVSNSLYSTSSTAWVDISALISITMTTAEATWVRLTLQGSLAHSGAASTYFDFAIDGARVGSGNTWGLYHDQGAGTAVHGFQVVWELQVAAGSHTFRPQWRVGFGVAFLYGGSSFCPILFTVEELL